MRVDSTEIEKYEYVLDAIMDLLHVHPDLEVILTDKGVDKARLVPYTPELKDLLENTPDQ